MFQKYRRKIVPSARTRSFYTLEIRGQTPFECLELLKLPISHFHWHGYGLFLLKITSMRVPFLHALGRLHSALALGFALITAIPSFAAQPDRTAKATLHDVRLYLDGAVLTQSFSVALPAGNSTVEVTGLAQQVDEQSIQLRTRSSLKVNGYRVEVRNTDWNAVSELKIWRDSLAYWKSVDEQARGQQAIIQLEKEAFLRSTQQTAYSEANQKFWAQSAAEWVRRTSLAQKNLDLAQRGTQRVNQKYQEEMNKHAAQESVLVLEVSAEAPVATALFSLETSTPLASWSPRYEVRMDDAASGRLDLISKATITQETGLDWKKVSLVLGSNRPRGGLSTPVLQPWWVGPQAAKFEAVAVRGGRAAPAIMAVESAIELDEIGNSRYKLASFDDAERSESLVGYSLTLPGTYSFTHQESREISLETQGLRADLSRYTAPRLDLRVFLIARLPGWDTLVQLDGPANLYLENNLVGNTYLTFQGAADTLDLAMGADPRTSVEWKPTVTTDNKGGKVERSYSYALKINTLHSKPVEVVVEDRTPMPRAEEVSLIQTEWGGGKRNAESGILTWKTTVGKDKPWSTVYRYVLRYPRNANVGPL